MKKLNKLFERVVISLAFAGLTIFTAACSTDAKDSASESPYLGDTLVVTGQQVYERNNMSYRVSTMHLLYKGADITIDAYVQNDTNKWEKVSNDGKVINGKLSVTVPALSGTELVTGDILMSHLPDWYYTPACAMKIVSEATGDDLESVSVGNLVNFFIAPAHDEILIREGFSGNQSSMSGEYIYYFYVNQNCTITANKGEDSTGFYTFAPLNLSLKTGWNTVCVKETYTTTGNSTYSAEVRNPDISWTVMPPLPF